jgi:prolipoprotein diacylglyceryltransferase
MILHTLFDLLAAAAAMAMTLAVYRWRLATSVAVIERAGTGYGAALIIGAVTGGYGFGTLNLWLSGIPGIGRSIVGALAGAIAAIELFKFARGIKSSTGLIFVPAFAASVAVGRWGCFLSGLDDNTHGIATELPWGHDFGDGILRHPVQLYESVTMAGFLAGALLLLKQRNSWFMANGFYLLVLVYGGQRFLWEFLKPYASVMGPFNLFHFLCFGLMVYSLSMMRGSKTQL